MSGKEYLEQMETAVRVKLLNPDSIYFGLEGHKRLARECGFALNDFDEKDRDEILHSSYSRIYIIGCNLKPLMDASQWMRIMRSQIKA